jgi:hypothetical protein
VDPVPDPLLLRKSGSTRNQIRDLRIFEPGTLTTGPQRQSVMPLRISDVLAQDVSVRLHTLSMA